MDLCCCGTHGRQATGRSSDRITFSDGRWHGPSAQVAADMVGSLAAALVLGSAPDRDNLRELCLWPTGTDLPGLGAISTRRPRRCLPSPTRRLAASAVNGDQTGPAQRSDVGARPARSRRRRRRAAGGCLTPRGQRRGFAAEHRHQPGVGNRGCRLIHRAGRPGHLTIIAWIRRMYCGRAGDEQSVEPTPVPRWQTSRRRSRAWAGSQPARTRTGTSLGSGRPTHRPQPRRSRPAQQNGPGLPVAIAVSRSVKNIRPDSRPGPAAMRYACA